MADKERQQQRFARIMNGEGLVELGTHLSHQLNQEAGPPLDDPVHGEVVNRSAERWLTELRKPEAERAYWHQSFRLPDAIREQVLEQVSTMQAADLTAVMREFCVPQGSLGKDAGSLEWLTAGDLAAPPTEYHRRLLRYFAGDKYTTPWEGMTWVLDLLPHAPQRAIEAITAYLAAHFWHLPDGRIDGLYDLLAIIRAVYIRQAGDRPDLDEHGVNAMLAITPREFEHLVAETYSRMGYFVELTPERGDGGRDVIASADGAGRRQRVLVECKAWAKRVGVDVVRQLAGVVSAEGATNGVLVGISGFTRGSIREASAQDRVELLDGKQLTILLNSHAGPEWPENIDRLIGASIRREQQSQIDQ